MSMYLCNPQSFNYSTDLHESQRSARHWVTLAFLRVINRSRRARIGPSASTWLFIGLSDAERKYSRANDVAREYFNNDDSSLATDKNSDSSAVKAWNSSS